MSANFTVAKKKFIQNLITRATLNGALPRSSMYVKDASNKRRKDFRNYLSNQLKAILQDILESKNHSDQMHYSTIKKLAKDCSQNFSDILTDGKLTLGLSQKLINLYWKLSWMLQGVAEPLHCPFDSIIIKELDKSVRHIVYTKLNDLEEYKSLVAAAKTKSDKMSIAKWELETYVGKVNYGD